MNPGCTVNPIAGRKKTSVAMETSVSKFTAAEGGARLAAAAAEKNTLAVEYSAFVATRLLHEDAYKIRGLLSKGFQRSVYVTRASRVACVTYELHILTDLTAVKALEYTDVEDWAVELEEKQVTVCTSQVFKRLLEDGVLTIPMLNVLIIDSCHLIFEDENLQFIMKCYKACKDTEQPRILALTYPLFTTAKDSEQTDNTINNNIKATSESTSDNTGIDDNCKDGETDIKDTDKIVDKDKKDEKLKVKNDNSKDNTIEISDVAQIEEISDEIEYKRIVEITDDDEQEKNELLNNEKDVEKSNIETEESHERIEKDIDEKTSVDKEKENEIVESAKLEDEVIEENTKLKKENEIKNTEIDSTCETKDEEKSIGVKDTDKAEDNVVNIEDCDSTCETKDEEKSIEVKETDKAKDNVVKIEDCQENIDDFDLYEKLEWKIEELEEALCCKMDLAEDIDGGKRLANTVAKPKEILVEYSPRAPWDALSDAYVELDSFMRDAVVSAKAFMDEHRYDPTEIYGDDLYEEFMSIPDPTIEPKQMFNQFLYILDQLGPYAADKAAFCLLVKLEKLKIKVPYERHFLLLCLCTSVFIKIRCEAELILSKYDDWEKIRLFSTPKVLRFAEILEQFQSPEQREKTYSINNDRNKESSDTTKVTKTETQVNDINGEENDVIKVDNNSLDEKECVNNENNVETIVNNDSVDTAESDPTRIETNDDNNTNVKDSTNIPKLVRSKTTELIKELDKCDFTALGNKIEDRVNTYEANLKDLDIDDLDIYYYEENTDVNENERNDIAVNDVTTDNTTDHNEIKDNTDSKNLNKDDSLSSTVKDGTISNNTKDRSEIDVKENNAIIVNEDDSVTATDNIVDNRIDLKVRTITDTDNNLELKTDNKSNIKTSKEDDGLTEQKYSVEQEDKDTLKLKFTNNSNKYSRNENLTTKHTNKQPNDNDTVKETKDRNDLKDSNEGDRKDNSKPTQKDLRNSRPEDNSNPNRAQDIDPEKQKGLGFRRPHRVRGRGRLHRTHAARLQQMQQNPDALCGIVFVKEPLVAKIMFMIIVDMSRSRPSLSHLCAQYCAVESEGDDCRPRGKKHEDVLKKFRMHECNLLLATSALEEGIDLPRCNLVVRWDVPQSYRSHGLCRSRARATRSSVALMGEAPSEGLLENLSVYKELDQIISRKCGCGIQNEPPASEEVYADVFTTIVKPYTPDEVIGDKKVTNSDRNDKKATESTRNVVEDTVVGDGKLDNDRSKKDASDITKNVAEDTVIEDKKADNDRSNKNEQRTANKNENEVIQNETVSDNDINDKNDSETTKDVKQNTKERVASTNGQTDNFDIDDEYSLNKENRRKDNERDVNNENESKDNESVGKIELVNVIDKNESLKIDESAKEAITNRDLKGIDIEKIIDVIIEESVVTSVESDVISEESAVTDKEPAVNNLESAVNVTKSDQLTKEALKIDKYDVNTREINITNIPMNCNKTRDNFKDVDTNFNIKYSFSKNGCACSSVCKCKSVNRSEFKNKTKGDDEFCSVDLSTAIALINRYCGKLPSDTFTRLAPQYWVERVELPDKKTGRPMPAFICTLRLPLNCPVKYNIVGHPMPTEVLARRMVALQACRILHKSGELDNQLMPIGKENFKAAELENIGHSDSENNDSARPGTTKRRQYYYKRTASAFTDCQPLVDSTDADIETQPWNDVRDSYKERFGADVARNTLYALSSRLWCALPERYNTRGRRLHAPQHAPHAVAVLMAARDVNGLHIPAFPVYTRSGEVRVSIEPAPLADVRLSPARARLVRRFMRFVFSDVLRVRRRGMRLHTEGSTHNNYYIVPTIRVAAEDGSSYVDIDWPFLELIYKHTEEKKNSVEKPVILHQDEDEEEVVEKKPKREREKDGRVKKTENPLLGPGEVFVFDSERYRDAVVTPWYRNRDQPQYFLVAEICWNLSPDSAFPSASHGSFREYYSAKYGVTLTQPHQPLLDVDHTSARLNLLTPRYVNRKGVALPVSSERTRRAKRDRLDQKQILVPELCAVHPFAAPLWFATVALPCVLYRINALLIADEIRRSVGMDVALGAAANRDAEPPKWPPLDFGWSLAEVLNTEEKIEKVDRKKEDDSRLEESSSRRTPSEEKEDKNSLPDEKEGEEKSLVLRQKTINDILQEKEDAESGFEIGTWSNDMASSIPPEEYDDYLEPLPPNLTFCTSASGGTNWSEPIDKPKLTFGASKTFSMAESDCSYISSDFDTDDSDLNSEGTDEETDSSGFCSRNSYAAMGVRIEYKTAHEAEAVDLERKVRVSSAPQPDPLDDELDVAAQRRILREGLPPEEYIEKYRNSVAKHKQDIVRANVIKTSDDIKDILPDMSKELEKLRKCLQIELNKRKERFNDINKGLNNVEPDNISVITEMSVKDGNNDEDIVNVANNDELRKLNNDADNVTTDNITFISKATVKVVNNDERAKSKINDNDANNVRADNTTIMEETSKNDAINDEKPKSKINYNVANNDITDHKSVINETTVNVVDNDNRAKSKVNDNSECNGITKEDICHAEEIEPKKEGNKGDFLTTYNEVMETKTNDCNKLFNNDIADVEINSKLNIINNKEKYVNEKVLNNDNYNTINDNAKDFNLKEDYLNKELLNEMFPYGDALDFNNGRVTLESIEKNKRILLEKFKTTLSEEEVKKMNCFSMLDIDVDSPDYVNDKIVNVGFDKKENYVDKVNAFRNPKEYTPYYEDGKGQNGKEFDFDYQPDLEEHPGPSPSVILQALTMSNANDGINLERLETIGDSFLKFAITAYLYCAHPAVHEGKLSHMRSKQVSNLNLYRLGRNKRLGARMIASKFEPHDNWLPPCHRPPPTHHPQAGDQEPHVHKDAAIDNAGCFIPYNLITQHSIPDKSIADCVEALIGAYLLEMGPRGALLFMSWLGISVLPRHELPLPPDHPYVVRGGGRQKPPSPPSPKRSYSSLSSSSDSEEQSSDEDQGPEETETSDCEWSWRGRPVGSLRPWSDGQGNWYQTVYGELRAPPSPLLRYVEDPEGELERMLSGYEALERTLQYRFRDRSLLLQALTHASHHQNRLTDCYQRLEFLGDAILDYLITRHLYEDARRHSPGALTDLRSALVNNTIFATLAARHGFHKYFRHMSPGLNEVLTKYVKIQEENGHSISEEHYLIQEDEMEQAEDVEVPKALGDLFESVAGAIFLDSGMSLGAVWSSYVRLMGAELEAFSAAAPKSPVRELLEAEPDTAKFGKPERLADGRRVRVCVEVFGRGAFKGIGRNYRIAKGTAARCALRHLRGTRPAKR